MSLLALRNQHSLHPNPCKLTTISCEMWMSQTILLQSPMQDKHSAKHFPRAASGVRIWETSLQKMRSAMLSSRNKHHRVQVHAKLWAPTLEPFRQVQKSKEPVSCFQNKMWEIYPVHAKRTQTVSAELVAILTWTKADGGHLRCKARLVARGYPDRHEGLWTPPSLRLCVHAEISWLACAVRRNGTHWSGDVRQHFLQRDFKDRSFSVKLAADALRLWERIRKRQIATQDIDVRLVL